MDKWINGEPDNEKAKEPDVIYVSKEEFKQEFYEEPFSTFSKKPKKIISWKAHFLFVFISFLILMFSIFVGFITAFFTIMASLFLFKNEELNKAQRRFYRLLKRSLVVLIGFLIGVFNPAFGLGIIMLYFMNHDVSKDKGFLGSFVQSQYNNFV